MILLSAMTSEGPRLAVKTSLGVLVLDEAFQRSRPTNPSLPTTLNAALTQGDGLRRVQSYIDTLLSRPQDLKEFVSREEDLRIGLPCLPRTVVCVGLNYRDHADEGKVPVPKSPVLFAKLANCLIGPDEPVVLPMDSNEVDYEAELGVVIGRRCRHVSADEALEYVAGYTCMNDVSARDFQRGDGQWVRAKSQDTFGPMGPYLITADEIPDPQTLRIRCLVNGQLLQDSNTSKMIFSVRNLIAFISRGITLEAGDVISTGTPHGVGFARTPPVFLKDGDRVVVEIDKVGRLSNPVRKSM